MSAWRLAPWAARDRVVDDVDLARFRGELRRPRPMVLRGVAAGWHAARTWTLPALRERVGDVQVPVMRVEDGLLGYSTDTGMHYETRRFRDFVDELGRDGEPRWFLSLRVQDHLPELAPELDPPPVYDAAPWRDDRLTIGTAGTTVPLHVELNHNIFALLCGEKEFALYPPWETHNVYPHAPWSGTPHLSRIDPRRGDFARFPRLARPAPWRCVLRDGDGIFIPRGWWHAVYTAAPSIGLGNWWADGAWTLLARAGKAYKFLRRVRS